MRISEMYIVVLNPLVRFNKAIKSRHNYDAESATILEIALPRVISDGHITPAVIALPCGEVRDFVSYIGWPAEVRPVF